MIGKRCLALVAKSWQFLAALTLMVVLTAESQAQVTLPDLGVDVAGTATAIGTSLGTVVASLVAIFGALLVVRLGLRWITRTVR